MARPRKLTDERGFTIVETLVAAFVLLVGMAGVVTIIDQASSTTTSNKAREQGLALNRELIEAAHSIPYGSLTPSTLVATVQGMPGLANAGAGSGWTIQRRGITYTVAMGVCSVDDSADNIGAHAANTFCANGTGTTSPATCQSMIGTPPSIAGTASATGVAAGDCGIDSNQDGLVDNLTTATATSCPGVTTVSAGTCDGQPEDYKRLVVLVVWDRGAGSRYSLDASTIPFSGLANAPSITAMSPAGITADTTGAYDVVPDGSGNTPSSLNFTATTDRTAQSLIWSLGGTDQATLNGPASSFSFTWNLGSVSSLSTQVPASGEVLDGNYLVSARALNAANLHGATYTDAIVMNRRKPFPPTNVQAGFDATNTQVTATWTPAPDHDIVGYRLYRQLPGQTTGSAVSGCGAGTPIAAPASGVTSMSCTDASPGASTPILYWVVAVDKDPAGSLRDGVESTHVSVGMNNLPPTTPTNVAITVTPQNGNKKDISLSWTASTDPNPGDTITYFICIDGTAAANCTTSRTSSPYTSKNQPASVTHTYQVYAQDNHNAASALSTPVVSG
jgi:Tfp pilus assembly protein PilV